MESPRAESRLNPVAAIAVDEPYLPCRSTCSATMSAQSLAPMLVANIRSIGAMVWCPCPERWTQAKASASPVQPLSAECGPDIPLVTEAEARTFEG